MALQESQILTWSTGITWQLLLVLGIGVVLFVIVALKPKLFWPLLVFTSILAQLPRISGYILADELFLGAIVCGGLVVIAVQRRPSNPSPYGLWTYHNLLFIALMLYLIVQAVRGGELSNESRVVRWVVLYGLLVVALFITSGRKLDARLVRKIAIATILGTALMLIIYIAQGYYFEQSLGRFGRYLSQDTLVAGSAYLMFPIVLVLPAITILLRDHSFKIRCLCWITLALVLFASTYFDSRVGWLTALVFSFILVRKIGLLRLGQVFFAVIIPILLFMVLFNNTIFVGFLEKVDSKVSDLHTTSQALVNPGSSDISRNLQIQAAIDAAQEDWHTQLFGHGINTHKTVILPHIQRLYSIYLPDYVYRTYLPGARDDKSVDIAVFRTTAFSALLVDTGLIGILLLYGTMAMATFKALRSRGPNRLAVALVTPLIVGWLFITNIQDVVLLYLCIIPGGLIEQFALYNPRHLNSRTNRFGALANIKA